MSRPARHFIKADGPHALLEIDLDAADLELVRKHLDPACIDGASNIHGRARDPSERRRSNLTGLLVCLAYHKACFHDYRPRFDDLRNLANAHPYLGDQGVDVGGWLIDTKGSQLGEGKPLRSIWNHHLYVREAEYHPNNIYVQGFHAYHVWDRIWLAGWKAARNLPDPKDGRRELVCRDLDPFPIPSADLVRATTKLENLTVPR